MATPKITQTKLHQYNLLRYHILPKVKTQPSKSSTSGKIPPVPTGILRKVFPPKPPPQQKEARKSLVNPNLKIPQTLPPLDLPLHSIQKKL